MIDWDKHPKAAYADVTFFDEYHCDIGSQLDISRPTQTKTVADAVEQEGEKWTHIDGSSKCRVIANYKNMSWIEWESGELYVVRNDCLKPIKPTISESEAVSIMKANRNLSFAALLEDYDVVKD